MFLKTDWGNKPLCLRLNNAAHGRTFKFYIATFLYPLIVNRYTKNNLLLAMPMSK